MIEATWKRSHQTLLEAVMSFLRKWPVLLQQKCYCWLHTFERNSCPEMLTTFEVGSSWTAKQAMSCFYPCPPLPSNVGICFQTQLCRLLCPPRFPEMNSEVINQKCGYRKGSFLNLSLTKFIQNYCVCFLSHGGVVTHMEELQNKRIVPHSFKAT